MMSRLSWVGGNTPTCVGKTQARPDRLPEWRKHPHVRGEDPPWTAPGYQPAETPPRAWGRHSGYVMAWVDPGNTPTCVGKTGKDPRCLRYTKKHPHVRGEDGECRPRHRAPGETPPRAWGRQSPVAPSRAFVRNTPTCVGKTSTNDQ